MLQPIMPQLCPNYAPLCPIMLHKFIKFLLPESEKKPIFQNFKAMYLPVWIITWLFY